MKMAFGITTVVPGSKEGRYNDDFKAYKMFKCILGLGLLSGIGQQKHPDKEIRTWKDDDINVQLMRLLM